MMLDTAHCNRTDTIEYAASGAVAKRQVRWIRRDPESGVALSTFHCALVQPPMLERTVLRMRVRDRQGNDWSRPVLDHVEARLEGSGIRVAVANGGWEAPDGTLRPGRWTTAGCEARDETGAALLAAIFAEVTA